MYVCVCLSVCLSVYMSAVDGGVFIYSDYIQTRFERAALDTNINYKLSVLSLAQLVTSNC